MAEPKGLVRFKYQLLISAFSTCIAYLTSPLSRSTTQYEQEQRQHAEQVETLRRLVEALERRVVQLNGQATRLARDYRTLVDNLRGRWK